MEIVLKPATKADMSFLLSVFIPKMRHQYMQARKNNEYLERFMLQPLAAYLFHNCNIQIIQHAEHRSLCLGYIIYFQDVLVHLFVKQPYRSQRIGTRALREVFGDRKFYTTFGTWREMHKRPDSLMRFFD